MEGMMKAKLPLGRFWIPTRMPMRCQRCQRGRRDGIQSYLHHKFEKRQQGEIIQMEEAAIDRQEKFDCQIR